MNRTQAQKNSKMEEQIPIQHIPFTVDAGIIHQLGFELLKKAETAVAELIKNAYDADARCVTVKFIDTDTAGGKLIIEDDGAGMNFDQLVNGFMRIATTNKIHETLSLKYKRKRAGKKGIGRFATHRLGEKLTIITYSKNEKHGLKLTVEWNDYQSDIALNTIVNPVETIDIDTTKSHGTQLIIEKLKEPWSKITIENAFRYITKLLQPNYLSERSKTLNLADSIDNSFVVDCTKITGDSIESITNIDNIYFDNAIAVIEGHVNQDKIASYTLKSEKFSINDTESIVYKEQLFYNIIKNINFKAYYFIYNLEDTADYYLHFAKSELKRVQELAQKSGGIYLYYDGFRVLPYGEQGNDWLKIDHIGKGRADVFAPFSNQNFFGFVEIIAEMPPLFGEVTGREGGLIENQAFEELTHFVRTALEAATNTIHAARLKASEASQSEAAEPNVEDEINEDFKRLKSAIPKRNKSAWKSVEQMEENFKKYRKFYAAKVDENRMLRVFAGLGLVLGEFTHEVKQFTPSITGLFDNLKRAIQENEALIRLEMTLTKFLSYINFFYKAIERNLDRRLEPVDMRILIKEFLQSIDNQSFKPNIEILTEYYGEQLYTLPMHPSEWFSVLSNFYTNSKKAIHRKGVEGKIKIVVERDAPNKVLKIDFMDNGDGIPPKNQKRIFDAFFSTSRDSDSDVLRQQGLLGSGLGLKIIKDIIENYKGSIQLVEADEGYNTCFRIEIKEATDKQKQNYEKN